MITINDLPIAGPYTVTDADTGRILHKYVDGPGDIPPDVACLPVLDVSAGPDGIRISTRVPAPDPVWDMIKARRKFIARQTAPYTPGSRRMY